MGSCSSEEGAITPSANLIDAMNDMFDSNPKIPQKRNNQNQRNNQPPINNNQISIQHQRAPVMKPAPVVPVGYVNYAHSLTQPMVMQPSVSPMTPYQNPIMAQSPMKNQMMQNSAYQNQSPSTQNQSPSDQSPMNQSHMTNQTPNSSVFPFALSLNQSQAAFARIDPYFHPFYHFCQKHKIQQCLKMFKEEDYKKKVPQISGLKIEEAETIQSLEILRKLTKLVLLKGQIDNLTYVGTLKNLKTLKICNKSSQKQSKSITKIQSLQKLDFLEHLTLQNHKIVKIQNLTPNFNLISLNLSKNSLFSIDGLDRLKKLKVLKLTNNQISKICGLDSLENLQELDLSCNFIEQIDNLDELSKLTILNLSNNKLESMNNLKCLKNLKTLNLQTNYITKFSYTANLNTLKHLLIMGNPLKNDSMKILLDYQWADLIKMSLSFEAYWQDPELEQVHGMFMDHKWNWSNLKEIKFREAISGKKKKEIEDYVKNLGKVIIWAKYQK